MIQAVTGARIVDRAETSCKIARSQEQENLLNAKQQSNQETKLEKLLLCFVSSLLCCFAALRQKGPAND
jgi:hypothetical protein